MAPVLTVPIQVQDDDLADPDITRQGGVRQLYGHSTGWWGGSGETWLMLSPCPNFNWYGRSSTT
jgi:hypothetical protein